MNASRMLSRAVTMAAGSSSDGIGSSHGTSGRASSGCPAPSPGPPSPVGSGRRPRLSSAVRHALVAIRYSHVRSVERPSKRSNARQARR